MFKKFSGIISLDIFLLLSLLSLGHSHNRTCLCWCPGGCPRFLWVSCLLLHSFFSLFLRLHTLLVSVQVGWFFLPRRFSYRVPSVNFWFWLRVLLNTRNPICFFFVTSVSSPILTIWWDSVIIPLILSAFHVSFSSWSIFIIAVVLSLFPKSSIWGLPKSDAVTCCFSYAWIILSCSLACSVSFSLKSRQFIF